MKTLYIIGGTMGVGKTTISQHLKKEIENSVFLDGDWCWDAHPIKVNEETKEMVLDNICYMLQNFIRCHAYESIIFGWVLHEQEIIDTILHRLDTSLCTVKCISLIADETCLRTRLEQDVKKGIRTRDSIEKSIASIPYYRILHTTKIDTTNKTVQQICDEIKKL